MKEKVRWCFQICNKCQDKNDFKEGSKHSILGYKIKFVPLLLNLNINIMYSSEDLENKTIVKIWLQTRKTFHTILGR